ncbi:two-component regulator propeller domain-containing protein [Pedobacter fastidiosus]|uniref:histidine kinase n=1 Tax=Pedobacter fastidiosus TaxID=2765361 RepID=A0ABR7KQS6_9SPHI|nr:sensor histidine kinase [Pedobacter fastidiosus]MBC6110319.1 histidine kinase [Pedobacter fastidiosus]
MSILQTRFFIFFLLLFATRLAFAQPYYFRHYQVDEGLSHNTIISLLQDHNGMIWVGTKGGLNSFNGHNFRSYFNKANSYGTIGNNFINSLCEDKNGMIWIGTGRGILRFDPVHEVFFQIPFNVADGVEQITIDKNNNIWFLKSDMLCRYNQLNKHLSYFPSVNGNSMKFDAFGKLWIGNHEGEVFKFDPANNSVSNIIQVLDKNLPYNQKVISKLLVLKDQILIGTTKHGLLTYSLVTKEIKALLSKNKDNTDIYVRDIISAEEENYWVATESGVYVFNLKNQQFTQLEKVPSNRYSISDNAVYCLLKDNEKGYWAGTFFGGLNYLSPENIKFTKYINIKGTNSISGNAVREICSYDNKNIWIGTEDAGVNRLELSTGKFTQFTTTGLSNSLSYPNIHGLFATKDKLYLGPFVHGLDIMDLKTGKILKRHSVIGSGDQFTSDFVMSIYQTSEKRILIGTIHGGLFEYDEQKDNFKRLNFIPENSNIYAIFEDHTGTIWVGSLQNGVFYYNPKTGLSGNIKFNKGNGFDYQIQGIYEDSRHFLWFASEGGGLISLDPDRKKITKITTSNGLPSNYLFRTLEDNTGNLWISSLKGLICLNLSTKKIKIFTRANGLITDQFNYNSAYKDVNGKMYFGTVQGLISFNPADILVKSVAPPLYLTAFQVNNEEVIPGKKGVLSQAILYTDTVRLNYNQSSFNIEFATFSYTSPKTIDYLYQMEGVGNNEWTNLRNNQKAYFTDLAPGTYNFLVKARDNVGGWVSKTRHIVIQIRPPFWKSGFAYFIYILLVLIAFYLSANYYRKMLESKNQRKLQLFEFEKDREIYQAKIEFFTNITHEIQTPLTLIKGPVERLLDRIEDAPAIKKSLQMIDKNTNRLLALTAQLLDFRKTEIDQFGLSFVKLNIIQVLRQEVTAFKPEIEKKHIKLELKFPKTSLIAFVDYEAFRKIISNLLSNALKYASSKIIIELLPTVEDHREFVIRFATDGEPIPKELREKIFEPFYRMSRNIDKPGTGIGLPIARSLAELHTGSLLLIEYQNGLNIFELKLPIHHSIEFNLSKWKKF